MEKSRERGCKHGELPLVSIVILTYKKFQHVWGAIDSVYCQDYPNIQLIISDDGSENFPQIEIEKYLGEKESINVQNYKIIHHEQNIGTVKNLNIAYGNADGEFIYPLSNDDIFTTSEIVSKITGVFLKTNCNVVVTSRMKCKEDGEPICLIPLRSELKYVNKLNTREKQFEAFLTEQYYEMASGSALYLRKSFWESIGRFDEKYRLWEDGPFIAKALAVEKIETCFDIVSIKYRIGGVSSGKKHPQLVIEKKLFDSSDKLIYAVQLNWLARKKIKFDIERNNANSKQMIIFSYLKNPIGLLIRFLYKTKRKIAKYREGKLGMY